MFTEKRDNKQLSSFAYNLNVSRGINIIYSVFLILALWFLCVGHITSVV